MGTGSLTFAEFAKTNRERCESPDGFNHRLESWSLSDWVTATLGELGEAANLVKKLNRLRDGIRTKESRDDLDAALFTEIGDTGVYLDLFAQAAGFRLEDAVREVFNEKSTEIGYPGKLEDRYDDDTTPHPDARDLLIADLYDMLRRLQQDGVAIDDRNAAMERATIHFAGMKRP
jgi:NTP pyrophosphatase (non-canonical NTP hydrolase)